MIKEAAFFAIFHLYRLLLRLYPSNFRAEFGEEMTAVFAESATGAARESGLALLAFCGRELRDLPAALLRQHWQNFRQMEEERKAMFKRRFLFFVIFAGLAVGWRLLASFYWGTGSGLWLGIVTYWPFALLLVGLFAWPMIRALGSVANGAGKRWLVVGLLSLATLFVPPAWPIALFANLTAEPFGGPTGLILIVLITLALAISAVLLHLGLKKSTARQTAVFHFSLSLLLLAKALHSLYWLLIWDSTYDPLNFFWLGLPLLGLFFIGTILFSVAEGKAKMAALFFGIGVPLLLIALAEQAQTVDFRQLTEQHAAQVSAAVEKYYDRNGRYPQNLHQLTPRYFLSLPKPVIIFGQTWCYDEGEAFYRLGYVSRQHWSDPRLTGELYKSIGTVPELAPLCQEEVATMQARYPEYPYEYWTANE